MTLATPLLSILATAGCEGTLGGASQAPDMVLGPSLAGGAGIAGDDLTAGDGLSIAGDGNAPYVAPAAVDGRLPARTWKLSHAEYARSLTVFLGVTLDVSAFQPEIDNGVYSNMSGSGLVRARLADDYYKAAEAASERVSEQQLVLLAGGRALDAGAAKEQFLQRAVAQAFRRPATAEDLDGYREIFELGADSSDASASYRAVIRALLTSPYFLYRTEIGSDPGTGNFSLTGHEVASLLAYSLTGAPPTEALLRAASNGELAAAAGIANQVGPLLETPDAATTWQRFLKEWLQIHGFAEIDKDNSIFPSFEAIRGAMEAETDSFLTDRGGMDGTLPALLTTPLAPTGELASFYASEPSSGGQLGERTGVLALGAVMASRAKANSTSPTLRGLFVRNRLLCQELHLPPNLPPDIVETVLRSMPRTTRELYELHAKNPACASCHSLMDSIGFNFESLDAAGRFRTMEGGVPVDTTGELRNADVSGITADHGDLADKLARSEWVRECLARQAFRFYFGQVEEDRGLPAVQAARAKLASGTFRDLVASLMASASTLERSRD